MNMDYEIVWFAGRPVAQVDPGGTTLYTVADHLGTPFLQTDSTGTVVWHAEYEPFGNVYTMRAGNRTDQPLRFPGQEAAMTWEGQEENYNAFRWYRSGWGRYTQADPIGLDGHDRNLYRYALSNPLSYVDPLGLDVRVCCRDFDFPGLNKKFDHCYVESNKGGNRKTWGLYGSELTVAFSPLLGAKKKRFGVPEIDDKSDLPNPSTKCGPWYQDCSNCLDRELSRYPIKDYSEVQAPLGFGGGRNSNTIVRCMLKKCLPTVGKPFHTKEAAGWDQPCPSGF